MSDGPLVSIITIFLNAQKFMEEALESVLAQTYANWELWLVDDGSTDGSSAIAQAYVARYPDRVHYLTHPNHENKGMSASRNLGIAHARGHYIAFLDADDVWLPHKLKQQVAILETQPAAGMVYGAPLYWHSWSGQAEDAQRDHVPELGLAPESLVKPGELLRRLFPLGKFAAPCPSDLLVRRELVESVGGFEDHFKILYDDQAFLTKVFLTAPVFVSGECWTRYRLHPDSTCAIAIRQGQHHSLLLFFLNWLSDYLQSQGVSDPQVWKALRRALWPYHHPVLYRLEKLPQYVSGRLKQAAKPFARRVLPLYIRRWWRDWRRGDRYPLVLTGWVRFGSLRRLTPVSQVYGYDRGNPIDRYYIENFLAQHATDIGGRVLEIGDATYTRRFGGSRVSGSEVLHVVEGNPEATIVADLTCAEHIASNSFDCIILTQTLQLIYDTRATLETLYRILKPGGILLTTFPGITQISDPAWAGQWYWSFTVVSAQRLFAEVFPPDKCEIETHGNVLAATAFLQGLAAKELRQAELDYHDPAYQLLITVRAVKPE